MIASTLERPARRDLALQWVAVGVGFGLLVVRSSASSLAAAPMILLALYAALAWMSIEARTGPGAKGSTWPVLVVGMVAVAGAAMVSGSPPPGPRSSWTIPLALAAALSEETFFRGLLYSALSRAGVAVAVVGTAVAFAALHVPAYGGAVFWVDLGAGLLLSWQRWASGSWRIPAATHAVANLLAVMR
jgi:membrane protease YdiL (CAAX protease family)